MELKRKLENDLEMATSVIKVVERLKETMNDKEVVKNLMNVVKFFVQYQDLVIKAISEGDEEKVKSLDTYIRELFA